MFQPSLHSQSAILPQCSPSFTAQIDCRDKCSGQANIRLCDLETISCPHQNETASLKKKKRIYSPCNRLTFSHPPTLLHDAGLCVYEWKQLQLYFSTKYDFTFLNFPPCSMNTPLDYNSAYLVWTNLFLKTHRGLFQYQPVAFSIYASQELSHLSKAVCSMCRNTPSGQTACVNGHPMDSALVWPRSIISL